MSHQQPLDQGWVAAPPVTAPVSQWAQPMPRPVLVELLPRVRAARIIVAAIAAGLLTQLLFVGQLFGLNLLLWTALVIASAWRLRRPGTKIDRLDLWIPAAAVAFAAFVTVRDDFALVAFDILAAGSLTLAAAVAIGGTQLTSRGLADAGLLTAAGAWLGLTGGERLRRGMTGLRPRHGSRPAVGAVVRGLALAVPLLLLFGALFVAADAVFAARVGELFRLPWEVHSPIERGLVALVAAWLFAGTMVAAWLTQRRPATRDHQASPAPRLGTTEALVMLLALDSLFVAFVVVQAAYLFGGLDTLAASGLTYSDYARRGFFELIVVAVIAGLVVLAADRVTATKAWSYRAAAAGLVVLIGIVLLSSTYRLGLYQAAYGWTELRFYALAMIGLLFVGVVGATVGVLSDRLSSLPKLLMGAGLAIAVAVNVIGPQSFVTASNLQRAIDPTLVAPGGKSGLDLYYIEYLGNDAVPALVSVRDRLPGPVAQEVSGLLQRRALALRSEAAELGWPSWNLARQRAYDALIEAGY